MRHIGFVKWFGDYDRYSETESQIGFIRFRKEDIFFHINDFMSNKRPQKGDLVTFELEDDKKTNKPKAISIKLLDDEEDIECIKKLAFNKSLRVSLRALPIYLNKIGFEEAKSLLKAKLSEFDNDTDRKDLISRLSDKFLELSSSLRSYLDYRRHFKLCMSMIKKGNLDEEEKIKLYAEALGSIKYPLPSDQELINLIPVDYLLKYKLIRDKLEIKEHYAICIKLLYNNESDPEFIEEILKEIIDLINLSKFDKQYYLDNLPDFVLIKKEELRKNLSTERHLDICFEVINNDPDKSNIKENIIQEVYNCLSNLSKYNEKYWNKIPSSIINQNKSIRSLIPLHKYIKVIMTLFSDNKIDTDDIILLKEKIITEYESQNYIDFSDLLNNNETKTFLLSKTVFDILPETVRIYLLIHAKENFTNEEITIITSLFSKINSRTREIILNKFTDSFLFKERSLFNFLNPVRKIEILIANNYSLELEWDKLDDKAKLYLLYYSIKSNSSLDFFIPKLKDESVPLQFAIKLLIAKNNQEEKDKYFLEAHDSFQSYVVEKAWEQNLELDFEPLLPTCKPRLVKYCETRPWPTDADKKNATYKVSRAYCPRARKECDLESINSYSFSTYSRLSGARLFADLNIAWKDWSILELLEYSGIEPKVNNLTNSLEYVPKLCGWINRLNEIRERLKCSKCGEPLVPNQKYAKNLARYNMTIASCGRSEDHDTNVYFNHCWNCRGIIDSRESKIRVGGFYKCIHCGKASPPNETHI